jgi:hypothetical protein
MSDLRDELKESLDEAEWSWLSPHADRDAVIVVSDDLDLVDVGIAIVNDQSASVQDWITRSLLYKPSVEQKIVWDTSQSKRFNALIVQPYVLIQELVA